MKPPVKGGLELIAEIESTGGTRPALWWLGHSGFVLKFHEIIFYLDPCVSDLPGRTRVTAAPLDAAQITNADLILCTHAHPGHMDPALPEMLAGSARARVVVPKRIAGQAHSLGIPYSRLTTTEDGLRVEYFKRGFYARIYAVPAAHPVLDWTPREGNAYLGYLVRMGEITFFHAGDGRCYPELADRLRPFNVNVAMLPIDGKSGAVGNFTISEAADLAEKIGARWLVPMHYGTFADQPESAEPFIAHMLGFRPALGFKVFESGERWILP